MKYLSLFSGIGAPEKALDRLGVPYELVGYSEIDKYASRSYAAIHNVSEDMNLGDITKIDATKLPKDIDLCFYGFPCQDISVAGNQKGLFNEDGTQTRSGLFFDALRIIEETKPRVAVAENVKNLTSKKFAGQFNLVLNSLEAAGYNNYWQVLNAKDFGIPQNRERVFIVSIRKDIDNGTFRFPEGFPLEIRLKDVLEDEVDEKFYLSDKAISGLDRRTLQNQQKGSGFGWNPTEGEGVAKTLSTSSGTKMTDNYIAVQKVKELSDVSYCIDANYHKGTSVEQFLTKKRRQLVVQDDACVKKVGALNSSQDGVVVSPDGIAPCHTAGHGNTPKVLVTEPTVKQIGNCCPTRTRDNPNQGRIYDTEGLSPSLNCMGGGNRQPFVPCENATAAAVRGRYNERVEIEEQLYVSDRETANAIVSTQPKASLIHKWGRIRKLTTKECFRLMDFDDADYEKAAAVNSNTQLYKQAGNSIVVAVPKFIIAQLIECGALNV